MAKREVWWTYSRKTGKRTKGYMVRDKKGRFKDYQSYKRAHGQDIKRSSKAERARKKKK